MRLHGSRTAGPTRQTAFHRAGQVHHEWQGDKPPVASKRKHGQRATALRNINNSLAMRRTRPLRRKHRGQRELLRWNRRGNQLILNRYNPTG
jgi:hypothetical protein